MVIKNKKGMTLIEVVVTLLVLTILLGAIYMVFDRSINTIMREDSRVENQQNLRQVALRIEQDIRRSSQIEDTIQNGSCYTINSNEFCLTNGTVYRNSEAIAYNIQSLSITTSNKIVSIQMQSVPDRYGQTITINTEVQLRGVRDE